MKCVSPPVQITSITFSLPTGTSDELAMVCPSDIQLMLEVVTGRSGGLKHIEPPYRARRAGRRKAQSVGPGAWIQEIHAEDRAVSSKSLGEQPVVGQHRCVVDEVGAVWPQLDTVALA